MILSVYELSHKQFIELWSFLIRQFEQSWSSVETDLLKQVLNAAPQLSKEDANVRVSKLKASYPFSVLVANKVLFENNLNLMQEDFLSSIKLINCEDTKACLLEL